jgi:hypothetical protein
MKPLAISVFFAFCSMLPASYAHALPSNARPNPIGTGWICNNGFKKVGEGCVKVEIPPNGKLNIYGNGWDCNNGFKKVGEGCVKVEIPPNGKLNIYGNGWDCNNGFKKTGEGCVKVEIPPNGKLNIYGNGWDCNNGFKKTGEGCVKVEIPPNGKLNIYGNGWDCISGYKAVSGGCILMTAEELKRLEERTKAVMATLAARRAALASGDSCETEHRSGAELCITVTDLEFNCSKSALDDHYNSCEARITYELETDYRGRGYLDVDVECRVEIGYSGHGFYSERTDSQREEESSSLYARGSDSETLSFSFSFSSFEEVRKARITSHRCEIDSIYLY